MQKLPIIILIALLAGCSNLRFPWVYRIDIPQGNFVTEEMLGDLESGMTPEQVEYVLGVPTLIDPFTADTWFYLMTYEPGKGETVTQQIVVHFAGGAYSHYEGQVTDDLKSKTTAGSDRALSERAEDRRRDVDGVEAVELPAPNPEADGDSASDSADADAAEDAGDASASDEETSDAPPSSDS
ncbi:MAG: outer membrane protein assembly factor BamE [Alcanivoracaceae bacterium]|nr:outer membrane protein assembly factor BamE [Alcanivoracaceae bacterium]